jgi:RNA polymerase sigma-70 factor (ECF subfamily)
VKDIDIAREIVQEVFANLWEKRDTIEHDRSPKSYLGTAVRNRCLNYLRDNKKYDSGMLEIEGLGESHTYIEQDHLVEDELKVKINEALNSLPDKCREIFIRNRMENKKYQEIADELKISVKTVEAQMSKALKIMREKLVDYISIFILIIEIFKHQ